MHRALLATLIIVLAVLAVVAALVGWSASASPAGAPVEPPPRPPEPVAAPVEVAPARVAKLPRHWLVAATPGLEDLAPEPTIGVRGVDPRAFLTGRLVWEPSGMPVVGARLQLTEMLLDTVLPTADARGAGLDGEYLLGEQVFSDRTGTFALPAIETERDPYLYIRYGTDLCDVHKVRRLPVAGERGRCWQGEYRIAERGGVRGRIVDENGEPLTDVRVRGVDDPLFREGELDEWLQEARIAGAERFDPKGIVGSDLASPWLRARDRMLPFPESTTGGAGRFALGGLRPGGLQLILQGPDRIVRRTDFVVDAGQTTDVGDVVLRRGERFAVRVVDSSEAPVRGVRVAVRPSDWDFGPEPKWTDEDGVAEFFLPGPEPQRREEEALLEPELLWRMRLRARRGREPGVAVMLARSLESPWQYMNEHPWPGVELALPGAAARVVELVSIRGGAVEGATVRVAPRFPAFTAQEVEPGRFVLRGILVRVPYVLVALAPGYAPAVVAPPWKGPIYMLPAFSTTVQVTDERGWPVAGARVRACGGPRFAALQPRRLELAPAGRLDADARPDRRAGSPGRRRHVAHADALSGLPPRARRGEDGPDDPATRAADPGASRAPWWRQGLRRRDGARTAGAALAGRRRLAARGLGRAVEVRAAQHADRRGRQLRAAGPAGGAVVAHGHRSGRASLRFVWLYSAWRLQSGNGAFYRLPSYASTEIATLAGQTIYVDLTLERPDDGEQPIVCGRITLGGKERAGLRVRLRGGRQRFGGPARFAVDVTETTDERGRFLLNGVGQASALRDAELSVQLRHGREWATVATQELEGVGLRGREPVDVAIDVPVGAIQLGMFDHRGQAMKGRMFRVERLAASGERDVPDPGEGGFALTLVADDTGTIRCDLLPAGHYRVSVRGESADRPVLRDAEVLVVAGETVFCDLHAVDLGAVPASAKR